jgi:SAM-dependent methyltransferase
MTAADVGKQPRTGIQSEVQVDSDDYARGARRRFATTLGFVPVLTAPILDLGPSNALGRAMEARFRVHIEHTGTYDLDREPLPKFRPGPWSTITAFEILEHVMNPLFVLDGCREIVRPDGVLYITVPRRHPHEWMFGKSPEHFHEFAPDELRWLIDKAGFAIARFETANTSEFALGVRPLLRRGFRNLLLVECRPRHTSAR